MTTQLRAGIDQSKPEVNLSGSVECDEVYVTAGHNGKPEEVKKRSQKKAQSPQGDSGTGDTRKRKARGKALLSALLDSLLSLPPRITY